MSMKKMIIWFEAQRAKGLTDKQIEKLFEKLTNTILQ